MKGEKKDDLVRYEMSDDEEEEEDYVDYDFAYGMNFNMATNNEDLQSEYCSELNADNKFLGMSHFDEASRAGFALDYSKKDLYPYTNGVKYKKRSSKEMPIVGGVNLNNNKITNTPSTSNNLNFKMDQQNKIRGNNLEKVGPNNAASNNFGNQNPCAYETNLTNVNQNFNFYDSEMEKVDFESNFDKGKIEKILDQRDLPNIIEDEGDSDIRDKDNIFETENYLKSNVFDKKINFDNTIRVPKNASSPGLGNNTLKNNTNNVLNLNGKTKILGENKSSNNLTPDKNEMFSVNKTGQGGHGYSRSIDDFDKVNLNSVSEEDLIKKYKEIKGKEIFNLDKYKVQGKEKEKNHPYSVPHNNDLIKSFNTLSDLEVELEGDSEQVTDFQRSFQPQIQSNKKKVLDDVNSENFKDIIIEENEEDIELHYIEKLKELQGQNEDLKMKLRVNNKFHNQDENNKDDSELVVENKELKEENDQLKEELEELKAKFEKKSRELIEHKSKYETLNFDHEVIQKKLADVKQQLTTAKSEINEKENSLNSVKAELRKKEDTLSTLTAENNNYKQQIENIRSEFNLHRQEMSKKAEKLTELQQRIFTLEQENIEIRSKSSEELMSLREQKQSYDSLKSNFMELKNQYDLISLKYQRVTDENYNHKRDLSLYEKEIYAKNDLIEKLKREMLDFDRKSLGNNTTSAGFKSGIDSKKDFKTVDYGDYLGDREDNFGYNINFSKNNSKLNSNNSNNSMYSNMYNKNMKRSSNDNLTAGFNKSNNTSFGVSNDKMENSMVSSGSTRVSHLSQELQNAKYPQNKKNFETKINILPSQKDIVKKESRILEIETKLYALQQEREKVSSELSRMPEFPKQKAQILKKKNFELSITEFNQQINSLKVELRELNAIKRDY